MKNKLFENHLKETMRKRPVFGMTIYSNCPQLIESLGYAGFDFAFIDAEHCPWEVTALKEAIIAARIAGVSPLVRVTEPGMIEIRKALEMGAEGVIVPHVRTLEDMQLCVRAAKFPPVGRRGFDTTVRAAQYGMGPSGSEYVAAANDTELVIPMAEDFEFIDNIDALMNVPGIDAINFGPADYSMSTNAPSGYNMKDSSVDEVMKLIVSKSAPKGISVMAPAVPPTYENAVSLINKGVNMVIMGSDMFNFQSAIKMIKKDTLDKYKG
ncbi:MAG: aldolase/citrate lyase family protein [Eubacteriales bacterium]|nr:aldolase/citrate lyase family protein [Eubacteriales bacterium]